MKPIIKIIAVTLVLSGLSFSQKALASPSITPVDAQRFEQSYEDWMRKIIKSLNPNLKFTPLAQIEFSENPKKWADYEDAQTLNHLPGLPEVQDPNYSNPFESPLTSLVAKRNLRVVLYSNTSEKEKGVIREFLAAKMKLTNQDQLNFESVYSAEEPKDANKSEIAAAKKTRALAIAMIASSIALLSAALYSIARKRGWKGINAASNEKPVTAAASALNATPDMTIAIKNASKTTLRKVLEVETAELIAKATLNGTRRFSNYVLAECEQEKLDKILNWIRVNKYKVKPQDSHYARLLLIGRIHQVQNEVVLQSIGQFNQINAMKTKFKQNSKKLAAAITKAPVKAPAKAEKPAKNTKPISLPEVAIQPTSSPEVTEVNL